MAQFIKKENLTISIGEYKDAQGNDKKQWRTIGEIISMMGDDGKPYQFFKLWGAGGVVDGKVFEQKENNQAQRPQQAQPQQQPPSYGNPPPQHAQQQQQQQPQYAPMQEPQNPPF
jgi:hypothetical protein